MLKRIFDIIVASVLLLILLIPLMLVSLLILIKIGNPIFFFQNRPGLHGRIFRMYKFRTMTFAMDKEGNLLNDNERLTKLGLWLRKTSIDEWPELVNVLKGEMSLVGPRPLLVEYLPLYNEYQKRRHEVKPGITGLAQINGRNAITWDEKFKYDIYYVDNYSFVLDLKILLKTATKVFKSKDVNQSENITMEKFDGN